MRKYDPSVGEFFEFLQFGSENEKGVASEVSKTGGLRFRM